MTTTTTAVSLSVAPTIVPSPALSSVTIGMMLADARLPVGGHVNSAGLEPALAGGMSPTQVPAYMLGRARTVTLVEAGTAVVARHVALLGAGQYVFGTAQQLALALGKVDRAWAARTPSRAVRDVSRSLGRGYQRLAGTLWAKHPAVIASGLVSTPSSPTLSRPVLLGIIAAMLKLEPLDPATPPGWVLAACAAAEEFVIDLAALTSSDAIPALGAPESEGWAEAHSRTTQRLFRA